MTEGDGDVDGSESNEKVEMSNIQRQVITAIRIELARLASSIKNKDKNVQPQDPDALAQEIQTIIFNNAKINNIQPKEIFRLLYMILINTEKGPKLGNYILDLGIENIVKVIEKRT